MATPSTATSNGSRTHEHRPSSQPSLQTQQHQPTTDGLLDHIQVSLGKLNTHAKTMMGEFDQQNALLNEIDENIDTSDQRLDVVSTKTQKLIERSKQCCWPWGVIGLFVLGIFILLVLLIFGE